jgi:oligopeptidase B
MPHSPPLAPRRPTSRTVHGVALADDYAWLRADNWMEVMRRPEVLDPDIRAHLEAENAYAEAMLAPLEGLRGRLFDELKGRIKEDDSAVPAPDGPYAYGSRYVTGGQHPLITRSNRDGSDEIVLLDGNALAEGLAYFRLAGSEHAPDHRHVAYAFDSNGSELFDIRIRRVDGLADLPETIAETSGSIVWANDGATLFYVRVDANHRPSRVFAHRIGTPAADDRLVYEETDPGFFVGLSKTQSNAYVLIDVHDHETSEVHIIDAGRPDEAPRCLIARRPGIEVDVDHHGDAWIIRSNDAAEDFRIVTAPLADPAPSAWRDLIAHEPGRLILAHSVYARHLVWLERVGGLPRIVIRRFADGATHAIAFAEEAYSLSLGGSLEFDTDTIRFVYSSMTTPAQVYDYDMETRARTLRKEQEVPSGHDPARYMTRRILAPARDGETVPVSLFYLKETPLDGSAPLLLYGYGAYGISIPASFSTNALSLVERGFVYAIAHVRGGKDKGYRWYAQGRREHKTNTFDDFVDAARALIAANYTAAGRIVAQGGSAGGMLMGAVANRAPELFAGIIAEVPFVDVLTTMLDDTLPLTPPEWPEWGNPIADEEAFRRILAYSPYDNVVRQAYPAILALAGLTDPRVTYWEPAKWVARLRAMKTDANPLLLKTNMDAGHGGASGRFDRLKEVALVQAFALQVTGRIEADQAGGAASRQT